MAVHVEPLRGRPDVAARRLALRGHLFASRRVFEQAAVREILMGAQDNLTTVLAVMLGVSIGAGRSDRWSLPASQPPSPKPSRWLGSSTARRGPGTITIGGFRGSVRCAPAPGGSRRLRRDLRHRVVRARVVDGQDQRRRAVARWSPAASGCIRCRLRGCGCWDDPQGRLRASDRSVASARRFGNIGTGAIRSSTRMLM